MKTSVVFSRKWLIRGGLALAVIAATLFMMRPQPIAVESAQAVVMPLEVTIDEDGRTRAVDRYIVTAPFTGRLARIELSEGECVTAGQVIARVEPMPLDAATRAQLEARLSAARARQRAADAALAQASAVRDQARREMERRQTLLAEGALSKELVEQFVLAFQTREEEVLAARETAGAAAAETAAVQASLLGEGATAGAAVAVRAPANGTVLRVPERSARIVNAGEPLIEIGDPAALEVVVDILTTDAVRIRPGMPVRLDRWGGAPLTARVRLVEPSAFTRISALGVEEQCINVILDLEQRPAELGDGYRVEASILVWASDSVLTVPASALFRARDAWQLFVEDNGRARIRNVTIGERNGTTAQVLDGLVPGQVVILFPSDQIEDGARVRTTRADSTVSR
jgi:HlyD family secretion protein